MIMPLAALGRFLRKMMSLHKDELPAAGKRVLVVGLGNHGMGDTRHSVGMAVLNHLANKLSVGDRWTRDRPCCGDVAFAPLGDLQLILMKPRRFMNVNGLSVVGAAEMYKLGVEDIYLVHDDLDKPLGKVALKLGGSARGHNGVRSCIHCLRSDHIVRVRVGIGRPAKGESVERYVLSRFTSTEREVLPQIFEQSTKLLLEHIQERHRTQPNPTVCGEPTNIPLKSDGA
uniref:peptidyl-tRNA hydrolase n=1 Tax=Pogona vitticeps TaxID=103695 RepID=A0A6J0TKS3_9SAUR